MLKIKVGSFVRYKYKNELGLVKEVTERGARVWYHSVSPYRDWETDRKSTRLNSSHSAKSRMPSSA